MHTFFGKSINVNEPRLMVAMMARLKERDSVDLMVDLKARDLADLRARDLVDLMVMNSVYLMVKDSVCLMVIDSVYLMVND